MQKSKQILLTFDYELGLGVKSGNVDNCILNPTKEIQKILKGFN